MNGELMNMIQLTLAAKNYIRNGSDSEQLASSKQVGTITFKFTEQDFGKKAPALETTDRAEWLKELADRGAEDFKLIAPDELESFDRLAMVNGLPCCMLCFYDGGITSWNKKWSLNPDTKLWDIELSESICRNTPPGKPQFQDITQPFITLLERIKVLAQKLGLGEFSFKFVKALDALQADFVAGNAMTPAHHRLLNAAIEAYVFGGANTWDHLGRNAAIQKGMIEEYNTLTKDLYRGITLACMYAVNEW